MSETPGGLPLMAQTQNSRYLTFNELAFAVNVLQTGVLDRDLTSPPGSPAEGDAYIVDSPATGAWAGHENDIAFYFGGVWNFLEPQLAQGNGIYVSDEDIRVRWSSGSPMGYVEDQGGGSGDVVGPASATDNAIARFDSTTGKLIQDSSATVSDGGALAITTIELGHASDTTLSRASAGNVNIEGNLVYRAGGTDVPLSDGGTGASLTDPNADRIMFWDDSAGAVTWLEAGSGLSITGTTISATGGALTNFTESVNTSAPNATIPVARLIATNAATNVDATFSPKGTGAITGHQADSTATGGDKRGTSAVDWQTDRSGATQVASGTNSTISGGRRNTASNTYATVGGGNTNAATGQQCTISGGSSNTASNTAATVCGGASNTASAIGAIVLGGQNNTADGVNSISMGEYSITRGITGAHSFASGLLANPGDSQRREFILRSDTTNATPEAVTTNNSAASTTNQIVLPNASLFAFQGHLVVRENATGDSKAIEFKGAIKRGANAASTAILGSVTQADLGADAGASTWTAAFTADTTNGALSITVTGEASHSLKWVARVTTTEIVG